MRINLDVYSDVICPWCFIGKRRLDGALAALDGRHEVGVTWRPFELNPDMPREGMDRKTYRSAKFGSWERSLALDAKVEAVGEAEGIPFAHHRICRTPNTLDAHRLVWFARQENLQDAVVEALFRAYFVEGVDVGDPGNLATVAVAAVMDAGRAERLLEGDEGEEVVRAEESWARRIGISGVPFILINGKYSVSGAQETRTLVSAFDQVAQLAESGAEVGEEGESVAG